MSPGGSPVEDAKRKQASGLPTPPLTSCVQARRRDIPRLFAWLCVWICTCGLRRWRVLSATLALLAAVIVAASWVLGSWGLIPYIGLRYLGVLALVLLILVAGAASGIQGRVVIVHTSANGSAIAFARRHRDGHWSASNLLSRPTRAGRAQPRQERPGAQLVRWAIARARAESVDVRFRAGNQDLAEKVYLPAGLVYDDGQRTKRFPRMIFTARTVPAHVQSELDGLIDRARAAGYPMRDVPQVKVTTTGMNRVSLGLPGEATVIWLTAATIDGGVADRTWTLAHELCHVLGHQSGERRLMTRGEKAAVLVAATGALGAFVAAALATGVLPVHLPGGSRAASWLAVVGLWLTPVMYVVGVRCTRAEEQRSDQLAARLFGAVLPESGVLRIRKTEGLGRFLPTVLLSHPHPADRRRAGQQEARNQGTHHPG